MRALLTKKDIVAEPPLSFVSILCTIKVTDVQCWPHDSAVTVPLGTVDTVL